MAAKTHRDVAAGYEDAATKAIEGLKDPEALKGATVDGVIAMAQVAATLALGQRVADLTEQLESGSLDVNVRGA